MLPAPSFLEREIEDEIRVERVSDSPERCEPWLMLTSLETGDRRLRDTTSLRELGLRETMLDPEGDQLPSDRLVRRELLERSFVLRIRSKRSV